MSIQLVRYVSSVWFILSVYLSIYRWQAIDGFYFIPSLTTRDLQNLDVKSLSLSEIISTSILYQVITILWKRDTNSSAFIASLYGTKCAIFPFLSTMTNILSNSSFDPIILKIGNLTMKSIDIDDQRLSNISKGYSFP